MTRNVIKRKQQGNTKSNPKSNLNLSLYAMILRVRTSSYKSYVHAKYTVFEKLDGSNISLEIIVNDFSCILLRRSKKYHDHLQLILIHHYADAVIDMLLISWVISNALGSRSKIITIQLIHFEIFLHISTYKLQFMCCY